jgi:predicted PurR-regulated permease PerM
MRFPRVSLHRHKDETSHDAVDPGATTRQERFVVELDTEQLREVSAVFAAPRWLRDLGLASWFLVGVALLAVGLTWVLGVTSTIVVPVVAGGVVATVASPLVSLLQRHRVPRPLGALIALLLLLGLGALIVLLVLGGVVAEGDKISAGLREAADKIQSWVQSLGVDNNAAESANQNTTTSTADAFHTLWSGLAKGIRGIASLAFGISFTVFALFFLLKDGPALREWLNGHLGVPRPIAQTITRDVVHSIRRYFLGVTIVAAFNGVVVGLGAVILGVPLAGTIAVVTLVTAYIPFIGAVVAGAFAVLLTLGTQGTTDAVIMLVIVILANGLLQNIVQPVAMGATLEMNPLLILVVTISAGAFFGTAGMVLAAPLTSAAIHISGDLARVRSAARVAQETSAAPLADPLADPG